MGPIYGPISSAISIGSPYQNDREIRPIDDDETQQSHRGQPESEHPDTTVCLRGNQGSLRSARRESSKPLKLDSEKRTPAIFRRVCDKRYIDRMALLRR